MAFLESPRFPVRVAFGMVGGPTFSTDRVVVESGDATRNRNWSQALRRYEADLASFTQPVYDEALAFFNIAAGMANEFRYHDPLDYTCTVAQSLVSLQADGTYQMYKRYALGGGFHDRKLVKIVAGTAVIEGPGSYSVDNNTGKITSLDSPSTAPTGFSCEFDVPVAFDSDDMPVQISGKNNARGFVLNWGQIKLVEVRNPSASIVDESAGGGGITGFYFDTFSSQDGPLSGRTSDTGHSYTDLLGYLISHFDRLQVGSGYLSSDTVGPDGRAGFMVADLAPTSGDYRVDANIHVEADADQGGDPWFEFLAIGGHWTLDGISGINVQVYNTLAVKLQGVGGGSYEPGYDGDGLGDANAWNATLHALGDGGLVIGTDFKLSIVFQADNVWVELNGHKVLSYLGQTSATDPGTVMAYMRTWDSPGYSPSLANMLDIAASYL